MHSGDYRGVSSSSSDSLGVGGVLDECESSWWNASEDEYDEDPDEPDDELDPELPEDFSDGDYPSDEVSYGLYWDENVLIGIFFLLGFGSIFSASGFGGLFKRVVILFAYES